MDAALTLAAHLVILATAVVTLASNVATRRRVSTVHDQIVEIHHIVNSEREAMLARQRQLTAALAEAGVDIPGETGGQR